MTPAAFRQECANAWDWRDRAKFEHAVRVFTDPDLKNLTREQLVARRDVLSVQMAAVTEQLARIDAVRRADITRLQQQAQQTGLDTRRSLDASE